jgi:hypothetical protein
MTCNLSDPTSFYEHDKMTTRPAPGSAMSRERGATRPGNRLTSAPRIGSGARLCSRSAGIGCRVTDLSSHHPGTRRDGPCRAGDERPLGRPQRLRVAGHVAERARSRHSRGCRRSRTRTRSCWSGPQRSSRSPHELPWWHWSPHAAAAPKTSAEAFAVAARRLGWDAWRDSRAGSQS